MLRILRSRMSSGASLPRFSSPWEAPFEYESPEIVETVATLTERFKNEIAAASVPELRNDDARHLAILNGISTRRLRVLDFGGACGDLFFLMDRLIPERLEEWAVVETAAMAAEARPRFENSRLKFHDSLEAAVDQNQAWDLVIASGVIQYVPEPLALLESLLTVHSDCFYLTRTLVSTSPDVVVTSQSSRLVDHGPSRDARGLTDKIVHHTLVLVPESEVLATISRSHDVTIKFQESEEVSRRSDGGRITFRAIGVAAPPRIK